MPTLSAIPEVTPSAFVMECARRAYEAGLVPNGHFIVCTPMGRIICITPSVYSFAAITYQATADGLRRIC